MYPFDSAGGARPRHSVIGVAQALNVALGQLLEAKAVLSLLTNATGHQWNCSQRCGRPTDTFEHETA
eukprot:2817120-Amphidinium_carterae.1